jgi:hypothetical protein
VMTIDSRSVAWKKIRDDWDLHDELRRRIQEKHSLQVERCDKMTGNDRRLLKIVNEMSDLKHSFGYTETGRFQWLLDRSKDLRDEQKQLRVETSKSWDETGKMTEKLLEIIVRIRFLLYD